MVVLGWVWCGRREGVGILGYLDCGLDVGWLIGDGSIKKFCSTQVYNGHKEILQFRLRSIFFAFLWGFSEKELSALEGHENFSRNLLP
jgi:hypothetical protein